MRREKEGITGAIVSILNFNRRDDSTKAPRISHLALRALRALRAQILEKVEVAKGWYRRERESMRGETIYPKFASSRVRRLDSGYTLICPRSNLFRTATLLSAFSIPPPPTSPPPHLFGRPLQPLSAPFPHSSTPTTDIVGCLLS